MLEVARCEEHLRGRGAEVGLGFERVHERTQPVPLDERVVVEQRHVVDVPEVVEREVVAGRVAEVAVGTDHARPRTSGHGPLDAAVGRRVVHEHDLEPLRWPVDSCETFEAALEEATSVAGDDDDADERRHSARSRSGCLRTKRRIPRQCQSVSLVRNLRSVAAACAWLTTASGTYQRSQPALAAR